MREGFKDLPMDPTEDLIDTTDIVDALLDWGRAAKARPHDETLRRYYLLVQLYASDAEREAFDGESVIAELVDRILS